MRADWADYDGNVSGEDVGIAIFDDPKNLQHPTTWHARHYGLLAANRFGLREFSHDRHQDGSYTIRARGSLTLRYRVFIHHGDFREAGVADAYRRYASGQWESEEWNRTLLGATFSRASRRLPPAWARLVG